jgi:hypothetical protein
LFSMCMTSVRPKSFLQSCGAVAEVIGDFIDSGWISSSCQIGAVGWTAYLMRRFGRTCLWGRHRHATCLANGSVAMCVMPCFVHATDSARRWIRVQPSPT